MQIVNKTDCAFTATAADVNVLYSDAIVYVCLFCQEAHRQ